jgi:hypothetical protein
LPNRWWIFFWVRAIQEIFGYAKVEFQNDAIQLLLTEIMESAKEGLMALAVKTGLKVFQVLLQ